MSQSRPLMAASLVVAAIAAGCKSSPPTPAKPPEHALSGLAAQHVVILPTYIVRVAPGLAWTLTRPADVGKALDADIATAFEARGIRTWILPAKLDSAFRRNPTYATDPHMLAEEPLRSPSLDIDQRLPEPIASQLRTLIALHDDARMVMAPVELKMESTTGGGHAVLRLVLVDARASSVRWIGEVTSDAAPAFGPALTADVAAKLSAVISP
jgi:hypothetical protein